MFYSQFKFPLHTPWIPKSYMQQIRVSRLWTLRPPLPLYLYPYRSAQGILFPRQLRMFTFPFAPCPLLPNSYSSFRTHIQAINRSCWSYLSMPFSGSCKTYLIGIPVCIYQWQLEWSVQNIKQSMPLSFLKSFNGFAVFCHGLQVLQVRAHTFFSTLLTHSHWMILFLASCAPSPCPRPPLCLEWCSAPSSFLTGSFLHIFTPRSQCQVILPWPLNLTCSTCVLSHHPISFTASNL